MQNLLMLQKLFRFYPQRNNSNQKAQHMLGFYFLFKIGKRFVVFNFKQ